MARAHLLRSQRHRPDDYRPPLASDEEWQCAELAQRYLYMFFGIKNLAQGSSDVGGGITIASSYWKQRIKGNLGIPLTFEQGSGPFGPGDVISYGSKAPGHVGIVTKVDPKTHMYTIIEQNASEDKGTGTISMRYTGSGNDIKPDGTPWGYPVAGWLHVTPFVVRPA